MPPHRNLAAVPVTHRDSPPDLRDLVAASIKAMDWLTDSDSALKGLAMRFAAEIEEATDRAREFRELRRDLAGDESAYKRLAKLEAECNATKTVGWQGQLLQGVLRDLGGTPAARAAMKRDKPVGSRLAQLRDAAGKHDS